jgi:hypothetical protein
MECLNCKKEFIPKQSRQKCCCRKCGKTYYILTHKKEKALTDKLYNLSHKKEISENGKRWRQENKQHKYEMDKAYRLNNPEKHNIHNRLWRKRHPDENRQTQKNYYHSHAKYDENFKIARNKRALIRNALKKEINTPETLLLLGCTMQEYWDYLISKFTTGMTKNNYGKFWCIDHIKPCCLFKLKKKKELLECFNYINTQPLTIEKNREKGNKY